MTAKMPPIILVVMGVSGCGKSTIGQMLAQRLSMPFFDGDDFHSVANVDKMKSGIPLTDQDRICWLEAINNQSMACIQAGSSAVFACSALKQKYREVLTKDLQSKIQFIYLKGDFDFILNRMSQREGHFMPVNLLKSQFEILEEPAEAFQVAIDNSPDAIIESILENLASSKQNIMKKTAFGLVGLGVMGKSLARNLAHNGVELSLFNRFIQGSEEQVAQKFIKNYPELSEAQGFEDLEAFVGSLQTPRKIFLMIKAGTETDDFIDKIIPFLSAKDVLIDGGNSYFEDTKRRIEYLKTKGVGFVGTGVSGGEEGALKGPSIMPSGQLADYELVAPFLLKIAAKDKQNNPCCTYIGADGSGHFIKMVHNGIEYAEMQLLAEVYGYFRHVLGYSPGLISDMMKEWNQGDLKSYLLEITADILSKKIDENWVVDTILDKAGNKGTGNWTTVTATQLGQPATMITAALFARYVSTIKEVIEPAHKDMAPLRNPEKETTVLQAYTLARIINHDQGFGLINEASKQYKWQLDLSEIARIWTNGCIIRSRHMEQLATKFEFINYVALGNNNQELKASLKQFAIACLENEVPIPCHSTALEYLAAMNGRTPTAQIVQAQRDYFGAHTYQKRNDASGQFYHTDWANI